LEGISKMKPKSAVADRQILFARLEELGIASITVEHEAVFTVEESQSLRERLPGAHTKNLFLVDKDGRAALVVAKDDTRVDLKSRSRAAHSPPLLTVAQGVAKPASAAHLPGKIGRAASLALPPAEYRVANPQGE